MRNPYIIPITIALMALGVVLANLSDLLQRSDVPGAGFAAGLLGLASLLSIGCPSAIGATWVVDRVQQGRRRRTGCM